MDARSKYSINHLDDQMLLNITDVALEEVAKLYEKEKLNKSCLRERIVV
jgi:Fe-S cluster assembly iron-binding protein IscA